MDNNLGVGGKMVTMFQQNPEDVTTHRVVCFSEIYRAYVNRTVVFSGFFHQGPKSK